MASPVPATRAEAVRAWMAAVRAQGWHDADLRSAAAGSELLPGEIMRLAGDKFDALGAVLDSAGAAACEAAALATGVRESLFDAIMAGFDVLQAERAAVLDIRRSGDPGVLLMVAARHPTAIRRLAGAADPPVTKLADQPRLLALGAIVARVFAVWTTDDSADLAATMAELDRLLARAERAETDGPLSLVPGLAGLRLPFSRRND